MDQHAARYSRGGILLHWLIALLLAGEIALGFAMPRDASGFALFQLHKSIGITILLLSLLRLGWRLAHRVPPPLEGGVSGFLARAVHVGFYIFMIGAPLTGWAVVSTAEVDIPTLLFGVVPWPDLPLPASLEGLAEETHEILAFVGLALFALHVAGALRHHFLIHDNLLARMAPGGSSGAVFGLLAAVLVVGGGVFLAVGSSGGEAAPAPSLASGSQDEESTPARAAETVALDETDATTNEAEADSNDIALDDESDEPAAEPAPAQAEAPAAPPEWAIQPGGTLRFTVDNGGSAINGGFARWSGDIVMDPERPATARIAISVDLASVSLGDATQDEMIVGPAFFATAANPRASWRSGAVRRLGGNRYEADGTLTLKGVSRPQKIAFTLSGSGNRRQVSGSATIDRTAFGVGTGPNAANLGPQVALTFAFEATR